MLQWKKIKYININTLERLVVLECNEQIYN